MKKILITKSLAHHLGTRLDVFPSEHVWINVAVTAEEMLEFHQNEGADLILLELDTPKMGGDRLCRHIRKMDALKVVSIILTSPDNTSALKRCFSSGANFIIPEPVVPENLIDKIDELTSIPRRENLRVLMNISRSDDPEENFYSTSKNISTTGILLETNKTLRENDRLKFSFHLRLNKIVCHGQVVRVEKIRHNLFNYGIRFTTIDPKSKALIEGFIKLRRSIS